MKLIQKNYENTIIIQKSKFIAEAYRVNSVDEVEQILSSIRKKYYDASHHCYAYRIDQNLQKMSDDGEPAKTAGAPILDVILKKNIEKILIVVTRYFGGTLLGAGGLVRAYSGAASKVIENAQFFHAVEQQRFHIICSYAEHQIIMKMMPYLQIEKTSFLSEVILLGSCKLEDYPKLQNDIYQFKLKDAKLEDLGVSLVEVPLDTFSE